LPDAKTDPHEPAAPRATASMTLLRTFFAITACGILLPGCEVRDEEARTGPSAAWLETMARRLGDKPAKAASRTDGGVECIDGFTSGARRATDAGLPMLLVFRASWCRWSGTLVATMLADERMAAASGRIVCVAIDADREAAVCRSFGVRTFPTLIVLDADRRERFRATGAAARRGLAAALETAVAPTAGRIAELPDRPAR
jgi:hypothetical protein